MLKTVLFQAIQFSINTLFSLIQTIDRILSGAAPPGQSGPGSDGNEELLRIRKSYGITEDCLMSYLEHLLGGGLTPL